MDTPNYYIAADGWSSGVPGVGQYMSPVTPAERESWNKYQAALSQVPGQYVRDWNRNQDIQKQVAQQTGFDYNRAAAIQADMMARSQSMPGSVSGVTGKDPWGGVPSWVGTREKQKAYRTYQYEHLDPSGKRYPGTAGFMSTGTEPLTQQQMQQHWQTAYPAATSSTPTTIPATNTLSLLCQVTPLNPVLESIRNLAFCWFCLFVHKRKLHLLLSLTSPFL